MNGIRNQHSRFVGRGRARLSVTCGVLGLIASGSLAAQDAGPRGFRAPPSNSFPSPVTFPAPVIVPQTMPMSRWSGEPAILPGDRFYHVGADRSAGWPAGRAYPAGRPTVSWPPTYARPIIAPYVHSAPPAALNGAIEIVPNVVRVEQPQSHATYQIVPRQSALPSHPDVQILPAPQDSEFYELPAPVR